jgi:predicted DNA-binding transcriptional regulator YafY
MRRADRLFQIVQILQHRRLTTAAALADRLQVSERTVYRDIRDLSLSGVPIQGEAGVGYRMGKDFELPPLMFDKSEIQALVLGARMVESWGDADLRRAAQSVLEKVEAALPPSERPRMHDTALFSVSFHVPKIVRHNLPPLRRSIDERRRLHFAYLDAEDHRTDRTVRPLGLYFWGNRWTLGAWCELRQDFRNFRVDRIEHADPLDDTFELVSPVTLDDYLRAMMND